MKLATVLRPILRAALMLFCGCAGLWLSSTSAAAQESFEPIPQQQASAYKFDLP